MTSVEKIIRQAQLKPVDLVVTTPPQRIVAFSVIWKMTNQIFMQLLPFCWIREFENALPYFKIASFLLSCQLVEMIAIEAKYHAKCLASLYNKARQLSKDADVNSACTEEPINEDELAFAELVAYIDEFMETEDPSVLKLSDMVQLFSSKFKSLHERINSTRLKERIMAAFPDLTAHSIGRDVVLAPRDDIVDVLMAAKQNKDSMICRLAKAARIIRKEIFQVKNL